MTLGDRVTFKVNNETLTGIIVNIYVVPKDYNLVDVDVNGTIYYGIETSEVSLIGVQS